MRLDAYLVETNHFESRTRSKKAIKGGHVRINGQIVTKPSKLVKQEDAVEVDEGYDRPEGYFKLAHIQEITNVLQPDDLALDIGSSAGGFLLFASEIVRKIQGIEYSLHFKPQLEKIVSDNENVSIIFADAFTVDLQLLSAEKVDIILSDLTLDPPDSLKILARLFPLLKPGGRLVQVIKINHGLSRKPVIDQIVSMDFTILNVLESEKEEMYIVAKKNNQ
ncbi:RNA-binding S4 domain protein [Methanosalsum zhilinae DSM 4017]|uniref:RNA-binding S4 domain protein n=1 Tax=Methanosalsum zhilinae (strain DSM 4017 / NBRC 107636 / OCM 62 / WeN5) TaxID=679901 RepID=F7XKM7_METZD|nr:S4 domain-containing protein [Methanosalsum zhilinae]AEH60631.1 RNA-binding S4 domain protein [Methanosalsum zhilinae DSM 4017]